MHKSHPVSCTTYIFLLVVHPGLHNTLTKLQKNTKQSIMQAPHLTLQLLTLSPELLLAVIKGLPNFSDLLSIILTHHVFNGVWRTNEFAVCEAISRNHFGPLWDNVRPLLVLQGTLKYHKEPMLGGHILFNECDPELGNGLLEGGTKIGLQEVSQMVPQYHRQLGLWRDEYIKNVLEYTSECPPKWCSIHIVALPISPDEQFRIDRAILRYWFLLISGASEVLAENDNQVWALNNGGGFPTTVHTISRKDHMEACARRSRAAQTFLSSLGEEEIQELKQVSGLSTVVLPLPGGAEIWGDQYYDGSLRVTREIRQLVCWGEIYIKRAAIICRLRTSNARQRDTYNAFTDFCAMTGL